MRRWMRRIRVFSLYPLKSWSMPARRSPVIAARCGLASVRVPLARLAHVNIYMDEDTRYSGAAHVVTDPLGLTAGDRLDGEWFPRP